MNETFHLPTILRTLPRAALLTAGLVLPLMAMHTVQAGSGNVIVGNYKHSNGAGLVLVYSLKRS
jgi:hypothetical protein